MTSLVGALDQGTTSTRFILFNHAGAIVSSAQKEHAQIYPSPGWCEHDPLEIYANTCTVIREAIDRVPCGGGGDDGVVTVESIGITNQRETCVVWSRTTGRPLFNAIVWHDVRTQAIVDRLIRGGGDGKEGEGKDRFRDVTGLPLVTYFSGSKLIWLLENVDGVREAAESGDAIFGTIDTWLLWNLTGGVNGGQHVTDVTNASRTLCMNINTLQWDAGMLDTLQIPPSMMPEIRSSSEVYGAVSADGPLPGVRIAGILGDQQAALFGQTCFTPGEAKNTYGTGCFFMQNTGSAPRQSNNGMLTTVAYKIGDQPAVYALEGAVAVAGALIQWLRDNLELISEAPEVETHALKVEDNGGAYLVPAFAGLFAPHWREDARGVIVGLTSFVTKNHICRAALEATAFQTREVIDAMFEDSGVPLTALKVDGGMTANNTLMQFQADMIGTPVILPEVAETTALGAAYAAGLAVGFWDSEEELRANWQVRKRWEPDMEAARRDALMKDWRKAVRRTLNWAGGDGEEEAGGAK